MKIKGIVYFRRMARTRCLFFTAKGQPTWELPAKRIKEFFSNLEYGCDFKRREAVLNITVSKKGSSHGK